MIRQLLGMLLLAWAMCTSGSAFAQETTTYTYDSLGRLTGSATTGSVNNGMTTLTGFDPAGNRTNYAVSPNSSSPVIFSISAPLPTVEGNTLIFTVTKSGTNAATVSVNYASANGTATSGSDYTAVSGTLNFTAGDVTKTVTVTTANDSSPEAAETLLINLSSPTGGASIAYSQASGIIADND